MPGQQTLAVNALGIAIKYLIGTLHYITWRRTLSRLCFGPRRNRAKKQRVLTAGEYKNTFGRKCACRAFL